MLLFLVCGVGAMVSHHFLYEELHHRPVNEGAGPISQALSKVNGSTGQQGVYNAVGNALALIAKTCFAAAIATAFMQLMWQRIRARPMAIKSIDATLKYESNPFDPSNWTTWCHASPLAAAATAATFLAALTIVTPGSLTVADLTSPRSCTVPTFDISKYDISLIGLSVTANPQVVAEVGLTRVVAQQLLTSDVTHVPIVPAASQYNLSFPALSVECTNITSEASTLEGLLPNNNDVLEAILWNSTNFINETSGALQINIAHRPANDLDGANPNYTGAEAFSCVPHLATYSITVRPDATTVDSVSTGDALILSGEIVNRSVACIGSGNTSDACIADVRIVEALAIYSALAGSLNGTVEDLMNGKQMLLYGAFVETETPLTWASNTPERMSSLMQNIVISLLARPPEDFNVTAPYDTTCLSAGMYFVYERSRLLWTYIACLLITLPVVCFGGLAVWKNNGVGETMGFMRIVDAVVDLESRLAAAEGQELELTPRTLVQADRTPGGGLGPARKNLV